MPLPRARFRSAGGSVRGDRPVAAAADPANLISNAVRYRPKAACCWQRAAPAASVSKSGYRTRHPARRVRRYRGVLSGKAPRRKTSGGYGLAVDRSQDLHRAGHSLFVTSRREGNVPVEIPLAHAARARAKKAALVPAR